MNSTEQDRGLLDSLQWGGQPKDLQARAGAGGSDAQF